MQLSASSALFMLAAASFTAPGVAADPLVQTMVIDAPVSAVWDLFTTSEGYATWATPLAKVDLRIGGAIRASYDPSSNLQDEKTIVNTIQSYEPGRMLSFRCTQTPAGFPFEEAMPKTWSVVLFEPVGDAQTRLSMVGLGYDDTEQSRQMRQFFDQGNSYLVDQMKKAIGDEPPAARSMDPDPSSVITVEATTKHSVEEMWKIWTSSEHAKGKLAPDAKIDLRFGGPFELYFVAGGPEGARGSEGCTVLSWLPQRMLSFTWNAPPMLPNAREMRTWVVLWFDEVQEGTRLRLTHMGFDELRAAHPEHAEEITRAQTYFRSAWPGLLAHLDAVEP